MPSLGYDMQLWMRDLVVAAGSRPEQRCVGLTHAAMHSRTNGSFRSSLPLRQ